MRRAVREDLGKGEKKADQESLFHGELLRGKDSNSRLITSCIREARVRLGGAVTMAEVDNFPVRVLNAISGGKPKDLAAKFVCHECLQQHCFRARLAY